MVFIQWPGCFRSYIFIANFLTQWNPDLSFKNLALSSGSREGARTFIHSWGTNMNYRSPCIDPLAMGFPRTFFIYNVIPTTINENTSGFGTAFRCPKYMSTKVSLELLTLLKFNIHLPLELPEYVIHPNSLEKPFHFSLLVKLDKLSAILTRAIKNDGVQHLHKQSGIGPIQWATSDCDWMDTTD